MSNKVQDDVFWDLETPPSTFFLLDVDLSFLSSFIASLELKGLALIVCEERLKTKPKFPIFVLISFDGNKRSALGKKGHG